MTANRSSLGKVVTGVGLAGLVLLGVGAAPAEAHDRGRWGRDWGSYRGSHRYSDYRYGRYSYGRPWRDDYRYSGSRYGRYGSNRGPYGDLDRDGRRNYWDRDKDGDGRRNERDRFPKNPRRR